MGEAEKAERGLTADWWVTDIGNSRTKSGFFPQNAAPSFFVHEPGWMMPASFPPRPPTRTAVASVNSLELKEWLHALELAGSDVRLVLESDGSIFKRGFATTDVDAPQTTGVDRVLACLGALRELPKKTVIVVDCGTATTVNVMTADRCFRGGVIMPGRRLLAKALHDGTAALPEVLPDVREIGFGKSTEASLQAGIAASMIGGIREAVATAKKEFADVEVLLTGGDAEFVHVAIPEFRREPHLTLHGLHWYATQSVDTSK